MNLVDAVQAILGDASLRGEVRASLVFARATEADAAVLRERLESGLRDVVWLSFDGGASARDELARLNRGRDTLLRSTRAIVVFQARQRASPGRANPNCIDKLLSRCQRLPTTEARRVRES